LENSSCTHFAQRLHFVLLPVGPAVSELLVTGEVGQNITVPCSYAVNEKSGTTSMCWGRGHCPASKCSQPLVWTDGWKVTYQYHSKYVLMGKLHEGDVSLTIINAKEEDSGTYCCRVEIPGLFNDKLTNLQVVIKKARISTASPHTYTSTQTSAPGSASEASFTAETWPSVSASETPQT
ncbi:HAVR1 protein, partial [Asarcornis scutulata]|nr:HAVR1 protein [Asarcornis scutulata]